MVIIEGKRLEQVVEHLSNEGEEKKQRWRCTDEPSEALPPLENKLQKVSLKNGGLNKVQKAKSKVRPNIVEVWKRK